MKEASLQSGESASAGETLSLLLRAAPASEKKSRKFAQIPNGLSLFVHNSPISAVDRMSLGCCGYKAATNRKLGEYAEWRPERFASILLLALLRALHYRSQWARNRSNFCAEQAREDNTPTASNARGGRQWAAGLSAAIK